MIRRPGNPKFSLASTASAIDSFYSFHRADGVIQVIADSLTDVEYLTPTSETPIWTKTTGAGQGYFAGVNESLYIGDGIDLVKYIPTTVNPTNQFGQGAKNSVWLFSPVPPIIAPTLTVTESGSGGVAWAASTFFSTMGLIVDSNNNIEVLISVNALLNNATQFGESGAGQPPWNQNIGATTPDNGITWLNVGQITLWAALTTYTPTQPIYDPASGGIYVVWGNLTVTSGSQKPVFGGIFVGDEGGFKWGRIGLIQQQGANLGGGDAGCAPWKPSEAYAQYDTYNSAIAEPIALPTTPGSALPTTPIYIQITRNAGTSGSGYVPPWPTITPVAGQQTIDGQLIWLCLGTKTWAPGKAYTTPSNPNTTFSAIVDSNGNFQVCSTSGISGATQPTWLDGHGNPTSYGDTTVDGSGATAVVWTCVGSAANSTWVANSSYYLPAAGFTLPSSTNPYGSAVVFDDSSPIDNEYVVDSGFSGGSAPTWATAKGGYTTDNQITWFNNGEYTGLGFSWTVGYGYVYCFKSRAANDPDVTVAPPLATVIPNNPNNNLGPLGPPTGCEDGSVSTASPVGFFGSPVASPNAGAIITVQGKYSQDPAIDTVMLFRSTDGFQTSGPYLLVTEIQNYPSLATDRNIPGTGLWTIFDFMADLPSVVEGVTLPGLNELIEAPIDDANDPVPGQFGSTQFQQTVDSNSPSDTDPFPSTSPGSGAIGFVYHQGRLWSFVGSNVFASGGPDTVVGNGFTAWPPTNVFPFQSNVSALLSTTSGLLVWTTTGLYIIGGGPAIVTYYSQLLVDGLGLLTANYLTLLAGVPYVFSADRQLIGIEPGTGIIRTGHPIGDKLAQFNPATGYLTYHSYGDLDHALFISDGVGTWYRCDTNLAPDSQYVGPVWSPAATILNGFKAIASIETAPGLKQLLIGPTAPGFVLARDSTYSIFADGGLPGTVTQGFPYESFFTMGSIMLATAGQMAELAFICADFIKTGSQPTVSVLFDEISATNGAAFEIISNSFVSDPPKLYGPVALPATIWSNRYYFGQTTPENSQIGDVPLPAWAKHIQVKVDFGDTDEVQNEMLAFTIFGALYQER